MDGNGGRESPQGNCCPKPIPIKSFYGKRSSCLSRASKITFPKDLQPLPPKFKDLLGPSRTWKIFRKQKEALDSAKVRGNGLMTFAYQQESGQRLFLVAHPTIFWHYDKNRSPHCRCTYEIIPENAPCKVYFDLEYYLKSNSVHNPDRMITTFIKIVSNFFSHYFKFSVDKSNVLILDSSTKTKFSNHLIFIFNGMYFRDNYHVGRFVKEICCEIRRVISDARIMSETPSLWSGVTHSNVCELLVCDAKDEKRLFCDESVYTKNRHFRLYGSTKLGKNAPLILSSINGYNVPSGGMSVEEQLFLASLVTYINEGPESPLEFGIQSAVRHRAENESREQSTLASEVPCQTQLETFVSGLISPAGRIRRRSIVETPQGQRILFDIQGYRYCANVGRQHRSNNIYIVLDGPRGTWYQMCYDPDCKGFHSEETPLPPEISFLIEKDECQAFEEDNFLLLEDIAECGELDVAFGSFWEDNMSDNVSPKESFEVDNGTIPDHGVTDSELMEVASIY